MRGLVLVVVMPLACGGQAEETHDAKMSRTIEELCAGSDELDCVPIETPEECEVKYENLRASASGSGCVDEYDEALDCIRDHGLRCNGRLKLNPPECSELLAEYNDCENL